MITYMKGHLGLRALIVLRWVFSIGFFFLAITKGQLLIKLGIEPYRVLTTTVGVPGIFSYYGVLAMIVEFGFAVGLWEKKMYIPVIIIAGVLTIIGLVISIVFIAFKLNADCGCGLLGGSEYGLLAQKILIILGLIVMYKNKNRLFVGENQANADIYRQ